MCFIYEGNINSINELRLLCILPEGNMEILPYIHGLLIYTISLSENNFAKGTFWHKKTQEQASPSMRMIE